jgi:hypothetical protein
MFLKYLYKEALEYSSTVSENLCFYNESVTPKSQKPPVLKLTSLSSYCTALFQIWI